MTNIRINSVREPFVAAALYAKAAQFLRRADAMGLVGEPIETLDAGAVQQVARAVAELGVAREPAARLSVGMRAAEVPAEALWEPYLDAATRALEASPLPERELQRLEATLGADLLADLLGVAPVSLARYLGGQRQTPDAVADRAHLLTALVAALEGTYNAYGLRRWFERPRSVLDGRSPREVLAGEWQSHHPAAVQVRALAESLAGFGAT